MSHFEVYCERREEPVQWRGPICFGGELGQEPGGAVLILWAR